MSNPPGPSASKNSGMSTQIAESQGSPSQLRVEVIVLRALNVPNIKSLFGRNRFGRKKRFFVTVAGHATIKKTSSVPIEGSTVQWSENVGAFYVQSSSRLVLCLYAARSAGRDILIGTHEMIPLESQSDVPVILSHGGRQAGQSMQPVTLYLTVTVSMNTTSHPGMRNLLSAGEAMRPSMLLAADDGAGMPLAQNALRDADEARSTINLSNTWEGALERIKWVMDTVGPVTELYPYARMAYNLLFAIPKTLLEWCQRDDNIRTLLVAIHDAFDFAYQEQTFKAIGRESWRAWVLMLMLQHVCNCCDFIQSYAKNMEFWKRMLKLKNIGGQVNRQIEDFHIVLIELRNAFLDEFVITTEITALQILDDVGIISAKFSNWFNGMATRLKWVSSQVSDTELNARIREIPYGTGSRFTPGKGCLPGTRMAYLDFIVDWVNSLDSERGLILFGQAGTGKSSIAHEIAHRFYKMHRLTSSFIFLRKEQSKREAYHLFTTLARDLSSRYPSFKAALGEVIKDNPSLRVGTRDYPTLFQSLILEPLKDLHIVGPILVVIDALDESGDVTDGNGLHKFLAKNLSRLPSNFRVLITSRPEDGIKSAFVGAPSVRIKYMNDLELAAKTHDDILTFLRTTLHSEELNQYCDALATKAEGLFQWAAVACGYILDPPDFFDFSGAKCIEHLLKPTADHFRPDPLDELYDEVLKGYFRHQGARRLFSSVMGQLIAALEPLSTRSLITLHQRASVSDNSDSESIGRMLRRLSSLLSNVDLSGQDFPIVPLHTSFRDFLTNEEKSGDFYVNLGHSHRRLAYSCLDLVLHDLKFNICDLESSYLANSDVQDLELRIAKHIPPALLYACRHWDDHLKHLDFESDLFNKLRAFFDKNFLFWLEVLSLTSNVRLALPALSSLNVWLVSGQGVSQVELEKLRAFVNDASAFVRYFGIAMAKSAPHVYLSSLPFAPTGSLVSAHYSSLFPRTLRVKRGRLSNWPSSEMVISNVGGQVLSIALSPDGWRIVSGSSDRTIRVWNATTGEKEAGPFTGHMESVTSVAFSPDGQRIVSGSSDRTIRIWNAITGETETGPLTGHTDSVWSVAFSPDGQRIVSGSDDRTIRVWNATTGEKVAGPFIGHTDWVWSVVFSPDGQRIVSGSNDQTIRVWNATTGEKLTAPFTGHTDPVWSVVFSPDGQRIVSGSSDRTIRVWNATTGEKVAGPFTGHMSSVTSVVFSPDGQRIVSGSSDRTIRVWDTTTGERVAGPFTGHSDSVWSVAFSPDGQRIVSGSDDRTIRVWNATTGERVVTPFTGHTDWIWSVAFSPDGQRIVSGSSDQTIRVWNAKTGEKVATPFTGHTDLVWSVAFSPDGQRIVSGSSDRTIRVWDATTGEKVAGPFTGHTDWVWSVVFSPDGQRIVSGSNDQTIRVWNAITGERVAGPFTGHVESVTSVAFSPDGQRIASGSSDRTIRVWNAKTGEKVAGPFTGHSSLVWSVAFSPDGRRIVSGSSDQTIRVWNAKTGEKVATPFTGHTDWVRSVAFSPDGQRIVSGSSDRTIRVWDATTGEKVVAPFTGHASAVTSVALSPDGKRIVSSGYGSIRMTDLTTGKTETTGQVNSIDQSKINDEGWILGSDNELLMWIPPVHRGNLHRPSDIWVVGEHETLLDLSTFVHGLSWGSCIST